MSASSFWISECHFTVLRDFPLNPFLTLHHQHRDAGCSPSSREQRGHLRRGLYCSGVDACFCAMQLCFSELSLGSNTSALHPPATSINVSARPLHGMLGTRRSCARTKENQGVWHCKGLGIHIWISFWSCYRLTWSPPVRVVSVTLTPSPTSAFKHCGCVSFFHTH